MAKMMGQPMGIFPKMKNFRLEKFSKLAKMNDYIMKKINLSVGNIFQTGEMTETNMEKLPSSLESLISMVNSSRMTKMAGNDMDAFSKIKKIMTNSVGEG